MQHALKIVTASSLGPRSEAHEGRKSDNTCDRAITTDINRLGTVVIGAHNTQGATRRGLKVLCATDFSLRSAHAVRRAALLTQQLDAQMLLLHVVDENQSASVIRRRAKRALIVLKRRARKLVRLDGDREGSVRIGKPHKTIARVAQEWGADLIVLGNQGRFGESFLGTTADHVTRAARRPVLIVKRRPSGPYAHMLLATDRPDTFVKVAGLTRDLGLLECVNVSIVQALRAPNGAVFYAAGMIEPRIGQYTRRIKQSSADATLAQLDLAGLNTARGTVIQQQASPFQTIECVVQRTNCDLLVLGTGRFPMLKRVIRASVSNEVQRNITCDVLVVSPAAVRRAQAYERQTTARPRRAGAAQAIEGYSCEPQIEHLWASERVGRCVESPQRTIKAPPVEPAPSL